MKHYFNRAVIFLFIALLCNGCISEYINDGREVCFEQEVSPLINSTCTQSTCHNSLDRAADMDFTTPDGILQIVHPGSYQKSELYNVITDPFNPMPMQPYNRLTKEQITTISLWIEQGAHTKDTCVAEICDTLSVTYSTSVKPILDNSCNGCHNGSNSSGINYSSFAGIKATINDGRFLGSIRHESGYVTMPKNGNKLSECKIAIIQKWIAAGAPNN